MNNRHYVLISIFVIIAISFISGMVLDRHITNRICTTRIDTLTVHDTLVEIKPKEVIKRVKDVVYVPVYESDTTYIHDTLMIPMPIEEKVYTDSNTYYAVVSGIRPSLDTISVISTTNTITVEKIIKDRNKWSIGFQAGVGTDFKSITPYVGIGIQRKIFGW